jgi:hypothetical protein
MAAQIRSPVAGAMRSRAGFGLLCPPLSASITTSVGLEDDMPDNKSEEAIKKLFDRFVEAFETFDGTIVGSLFIAPGVALKRDGTLQGFPVQQDIVAYYQTALDNYRASDCCGCRYSQLKIDFLNERSAVATATWDLLRRNDSVISHWRQAYFMTLSAGNWRIFGSAFVSD